MRLNEGLGSLTEKEKQTLRLMVRGHDAKSIARSLGLSVHTINERLRDARRKMTVSSSREAARLLLEAEGTVSPNPDLSVYASIGEDASRPPVDQDTAPISGAWRPSRRSWIIGVPVMTLAFGLLALALVPQVDLSPPSISTTASVALEQEVVSTAQHWLAMVDQGRWDESYQATGASFRKLNTVEVWAAVSEKARVPLGAVISRTFVSQENLPAPPGGYEVVKFRTRFANKAGAVETVTLSREGDRWRVVGVTIG